MAGRDRSCAWEDRLWGEKREVTRDENPSGRAQEKNIHTHELSPQSGALGKGEDFGAFVIREKGRTGNKTRRGEEPMSREKSNQKHGKS